MTALELGSVQKTMLLPLWGRAVETGKAGTGPVGIELHPEFPRIRAHSAEPFRYDARFFA